MALVTHRDPANVGAAVARWYAARHDADPAIVEVVDAEHPSIGYSSETVLVDLVCGCVPEMLVVRLAPPQVGTFRDYDLAHQASAQLAAAAAGVAIADPELVTDPQWLGTDFLVMPHVPGHIIGEVAVLDPWILELSEADRARVHEAFIGAVVATHRADPAVATRVPRRDNAAELDFWADYLSWSSGGKPVPALVDALAWCRDHQPATESDPVLLWGDVRFGNVIYGDDFVPRAVLDWDMSSIGAPEHDIAWFVAIEDTTRTLLGQGIEGFPDCAGIVAQYEALSGRKLHDLAWYEILARVRSTAILARIGYLHEEAGQPNPMPVEGSPLLDLLQAKIAAFETA